MNATDQVLEWNSEKMEWIQPGSILLRPRINHAVGTIPYSALDLCS